MKTRLARFVRHGVLAGVALLLGSLIARAYDTSWIHSNQPISAASLKADLDEIQARLAAVAPAGTIVAYGGPQAQSDGGTIPGGWLLCDGSAVSRTDYAALFAAIGVNFGEGDKTSTFNLPDFRGYFLRGLDPKAAHDPDGAKRAIGSIQPSATKLPNAAFTVSSVSNHNHGGSTGGSNVSVTMWGGGDRTFGFGSDARSDTSHQHSIAPDGAHTHTIGGGDPETRPANIAVNYLIKY